MHRWLVGMLALVTLSGCGPAGQGAGTDRDIALAAADVPRIATSPQDATDAGAAVNAFGLDLYRRVAAQDPAANAVLSPASIALALAMARAGARGQTATEMDAVLHELGTDEHAAWPAALDEALTARTGTFTDRNGEPADVTLRIANAPFADRSMPLEPAYLDALGARFGAGLRLVDFKSAPEAARALVNGWVADQTEQRIPELLQPGTVDDRTRLALVNAIYLKAAWQFPFDEGSTSPGPFTTLAGTTVNVPLMRDMDEFGYAVGQRMEGGRAAVRRRQARDARDRAGRPRRVRGDARPAGARRDHGRARDPRRSTSRCPSSRRGRSSSLGDLLAALGMPTAFTDHADFSGITTEEPLLISAVVHQADIDVDEQGTEAVRGDRGHDARGLAPARRRRPDRGSPVPVRPSGPRDRRGRVPGTDRGPVGGDGARVLGPAHFRLISIATMASTAPDTTTCDISTMASEVSSGCSMTRNLRPGGRDSVSGQRKRRADQP